MSRSIVIFKKAMGYFYIRELNFGYENEVCKSNDFIY